MSIFIILDYFDAVVPWKIENRCQIPWMRPQENFYYYDPATCQCINFPYTGACRSQNDAMYGYSNVFSSYGECTMSSPLQDCVLDYNFPDYAPNTNGRYLSIKNSSAH